MAFILVLIHSYHLRYPQIRDNHHMGSILLNNDNYMRFYILSCDINGKIVAHASVLYLYSLQTSLSPKLSIHKLKKVFQPWNHLFLPNLNMCTCRSEHDKWKILSSNLRTSDLEKRHHTSHLDKVQRWQLSKMEKQRYGYISIFNLSLAEKQKVLHASSPDTYFKCGCRLLNKDRILMVNSTSFPEEAIKKARQKP